MIKPVYRVWGVSVMVCPALVYKIITAFRKICYKFAAGYRGYNKLLQMQHLRSGGRKGTGCKKKKERCSVIVRYSAREERWIPMEIKGVHGYFCDLRIDRTTVPNRFDFWELADGDSDGMPCRYKFGILVNFIGTFITTGRLPVDDIEYREGYINSGDEWEFLDGSYSFSEIEEMERGTNRIGARYSCGASAPSFGQAVP